MTPTHYRSNPPWQHGGARNSAHRSNDTLCEKQCSNIIQGSILAYRSCCELNRFITIHWQRGGLSDDQAARATGRFIKYCSDWMRRHDYQLTWLWVRENDGKASRIGSHVHILMHVPMELAHLFRPFPLRWVKRILPKKYVRRTLMAKTIPGYSNVESNPERYLLNLKRTVEYLLKAVSRDSAIILHLRLYERRGSVVGKRSAVCQHLLASIRVHPLQL